MPTSEELKLLQNLPLEIKVAKTKLRIREWVNYWGAENCYVSFSGGKDSTVLLDIVRQEYPQIEAVFVDTGLEYPEIKEFVKGYDNVAKLRPEMNFKQVILEYGYPIIGKEIAHMISNKRRGNHGYDHRFDINAEKSRFNVAPKWHFLAEQDAPFKVDERCCNIMKKKPVHKYSKKTGKMSIIGTTADESLIRKQRWLADGCNAFSGSNPKSAPLSFWKEQDVLQYIYVNKLPIASVYGDVVCEKGKYRTTGVNRTGCVFCGFGVHLEKEPNRYQQLYTTHPKLWDYCMRPVEENGLGFQKVMDAIGVKTKPDEDIFENCNNKNDRLADSESVLFMEEL